jgi:hypothetical protein
MVEHGLVVCVLLFDGVFYFCARGQTLSALNVGFLLFLVVCNGSAHRFGSIQKGKIHLFVLNR